MKARYNFKFLKENDAIEPDYDELYYNNYTTLYDRVANIFSYKNLPATIPEYILKKLVILFGRSFWFEEKGRIICDKGNNGGYLDLYHRPMTALIVNEYDGVNGEYQIYYENAIDDLNVYDETVKSFPVCCRLRCDDSEIGLHGIISKYAFLMTHADISLALACIQARAHGIASGVGDKGQKELQIFYENLLKGKIYSLKENPIDENTYKILPFVHTVSDTITQLIELKQFYFSEFLNEIGITTNSNKKMAQQNNIELEINNEISNSLVDSMFACQKADIELINNYFGLNIEIVKNYNDTPTKNAINDDEPDFEDEPNDDDESNDNDEPNDNDEGGEQ